MEGYLPIPIFNKGLLISKYPFHTGAILEKTALFRAYCQQALKADYSPAEHPRSHCKQNECSSLSCFTV